MAIGGMTRNRERENMGFRIEDNCVGCPMGCINCGRRHQHVYYCDKCDDYCDGDNPLYEYEGQELCWECYKANFNEKLLDDCDDDRCSECGAETEFLYEIAANTWVCENCLKEMAERVDID